MITTMLCEDFKRARTFEVCFCFEKEIFDLISEGKKHKASVFFSILQNYYYYTNNRYINIQFAMTSDSESESDDEEYNQGPDIFEAAADEEIKEDHWCARFSFSFFPCCQMQKGNSIFSSLILKFSSPFSSRREYHMRKNMNDGAGDAVYRNLAYKAVCNCMPVCKEGCMNPYWMWTKK